MSFPLRLPKSSRALYLVLLAISIATAATGYAESPAVEEGFFDSDGVTLRYVKSGKGAPVVLLHGFTGTVERNWMRNGVFYKLAKDFEVVGLDVRGHGKSDKPHEPAAYGDPMALDVVRLLDHLGHEKAYVVGYSMGGFIVLKLVTLAPDRIAGAVLGGAGWMVHPNGQGEETHEELARAIENGQGITPLLVALNPPGEPLPPPEMLEMSSGMALAGNDLEAMAAYSRGMLGLMVDGEAIDRIEVPMLAVVGSRDPIRSMVDLLDARKPELEVRVIEGADHGTALGSPRLVEAIHDFVAENCHCL